MRIGVNGDGTNARLVVKGQVIFNSNRGGISTFLDSNSNLNLDINVESGATLTTCENIFSAITGRVREGSKVNFSGTGYTCDQNSVVFFGTVAVEVAEVDKPNCQACP